MHIMLTYVEQNQSVLNTLQQVDSNSNQSNICIFATLLIGHKKRQDAVAVYAKETAVDHRRQSLVPQAIVPVWTNWWQTLGHCNICVALFLCCRSTKNLRNQFVLCILCIFWFYKHLLLFSAWVDKCQPWIIYKQTSSSFVCHSSVLHTRTRSLPFHLSQWGRLGQ